MQTATHGQLVHSGPPPLSDRLFGFVVTVWFLVFALWPLWHGASPRMWALGASAAAGALAIAWPTPFAPLNRAFRWFAGYAGLALQTVVTALLFGLVFVPLGLAMRRGLRERLGFTFETDAASYWKPREKAQIAPDMRRQF